jgi:hypothetical protein
MKRFDLQALPVAIWRDKGRAVLRLRSVFFLGAWRCSHCGNRLASLSEDGLLYLPEGFDARGPIAQLRQTVNVGAFEQGHTARGCHFAPSPRHARRRTNGVARRACYTKEASERDVLDGKRGDQEREHLQRVIETPGARGVLSFGGETTPFSVECPNPGCRLISCVPGLLPLSAWRRLQSNDPNASRFLALLWGVPKLAPIHTTE